MSINITNTSRDVLGFFHKNPTREIHIRGLSDETGIPYSSVRNALGELESKGYLVRNEKAKMTFYRANRDNPRYRHRKILYNLESLYESGLIKEIDELNRPDAVVLFGSYLDGTDTEVSDIDIAVINGRNKDMETDNLSEQLNREIQLTHIDNPQEENREFRNTLANGYILHGYLELIQE